jgi:asparagine synthase (glutamine-hydrolysing)
MIADVPLGAFLSGGYDSSLVCALMAEQSTQRVKTFSLGFEDPRYNEAAHAGRVAAHLETDHTELYVSADDLLDSMQELPRLMDEPFADSSILPTYLVSKMARADVTVALSGDGGDELFWGYGRYYTTQKLWQKIRLIPAPVGKGLAALLTNQKLNNLTAGIKAPAWGGREGLMNQKFAAASELFEATTHHQAFYESLMSHWKNPQDILLQATQELTTPYNDINHFSQSFQPFARMAWQDTAAYLPDDILTKVDRASMAVSLEARLPLLDHRVVELAASLPAAMKYQNGESKWALRRILERYVPRELTDRPKMGFGVPLDSWLREPLQDWAENLLAARHLDDQGIFDSDPIRVLWQDHLDGRANNAAKLWDVLSLQNWLATNYSTKP